jgi:hypothetical protein
MWPKYSPLATRLRVSAFNATPHPPGTSRANERIRAQIAQLGSMNPGVDAST